LVELKMSESKGAVTRRPKRSTKLSNSEIEEAVNAHINLRQL